MLQNERNIILLKMINEYPDYFLLEKSKRNFFLKKIGKKYNMQIRQIIREKRIALLALEFALRNGRKNVSIKDIEEARKYNISMIRDERISILRLENLLRSEDNKLADKVIEIINRNRINRMNEAAS